MYSETSQGITVTSTILGRSLSIMSEPYFDARTSTSCQDFSIIWGSEHRMWALSSRHRLSIMSGFLVVPGLQHHISPAECVWTWVSLQDISMHQIFPQYIHLSTTSCPQGHMRASSWCQNLSFIIRSSLPCQTSSIMSVLRYHVGTSARGPWYDTGHLSDSWHHVRFSVPCDSLSIVISGLYHLLRNSPACQTSI